MEFSDDGKRLSSKDASSLHSVPWEEGGCCNELRCIMRSTTPCITCSLACMFCSRFGGRNHCTPFLMFSEISPLFDLPPQILTADGGNSVSV